jgi:hypothetical protein
MSNHTLTRTTSTVLTVDLGDGPTVEIDDTWSEPVDDVHVGPLAEDGTRRLAWLVQDDHCSMDSPLDNEGITWDSFRRGDPDRFGGDIDAVNAHLRDNEGRAFLVECYSHGSDHYSLVADGKFYPDRQWDVGVAGIITMADDFTNPREAAAATMAEYTDWCNGEVYGVMVRTVEADGTVTDPGDDCWGFVGYEYADSEARDAAGLS